MATILNASTSSGLVATADNSGIITHQSNGTNTLSIATTGLTTIAYNGANAGIVPGQQFYALNSGYVGANATGAQNVFGLTNGVTLSSSTQYNFEISFALQKTAGTTSHNLNVGFGGTATNNYIFFQGIYSPTLNTGTLPVASAGNYLTNTTTASIQYISSSTTAAGIFNFLVKGIISINAGGTFNPQYTLSAAPGGAYTTLTGSYMNIYPLAASGSNVSIGTWS